MKILLAFAVILTVSSLGDAYSKYGRSCKDIGCPTNQVCVMQEDPCTVYSRNECGKYPTCQKVSNAAATCATYICPPTKICKMDGGVPKCFDDPAATGTRENKQPVQSYNPGSPGGDTPSAPVLPPNYPQASFPQNPSYNPGYPQNTNYHQPGVYPNLPGQTTSRPNVYQPGQHAGGGGYQGGAIGSGYPGQSGYPRQGSGYPNQAGGYPSQSGGYPGQYYPGQGGNTNQRGGYPNQGGGGYPIQGGGGYPTQGGGYPSQGGYYNQNNQNRGGNRYGQKSGQDSSNPLVDRITDTLKTLGLFWFLVKFMVSRVYGIYS